MSGFGLLEALVALVLLSSVGFTLMAWVQQNLDALQRLRGVYAELDARRAVLEWSKGLNPLDRPSGEAPLGALRVVWKAEAVIAPVTQMGYPRGMGVHDLGLYTVKLSVFRGREPGPWFEEELTAVGHQKTRDLRSPFSAS